MSGYLTASPLCFSVLPVQCLCEFLLTQSVGSVEDGGGTSGRPPAPARHHQLLSHLQRLVRHPSHDQRAYVELVEYFLRRLSSQLRQARLQAAKVRHRPADCISIGPTRRHWARGSVVVFLVCRHWMSRCEVMSMVSSG